jgi:hypothetical protein
MDNRHFARAKVKWPVLINTDDHSGDGVTLDLSPNGAYIGCANPLRLNEVFNMTMDVPDSEFSIEAKAEVVFSNKYGPDDRISPRGMGVRFLHIASKDRQIIAKEVLQHLQSEKAKIDYGKLQALQTLIIDPNETNPESS